MTLLTKDKEPKMPFLTGGNANAQFSLCKNSTVVQSNGGKKANLNHQLL